MGEATLQQILQAREDRAARQQALLARFGKPLICFTMNIAGPVKLDPLILWGFSYGKSLLNAQLKGEKLEILHVEEDIARTGCQGFWVVDAPALKLKALAAEIEDSLPVGRLFDMDVLDTDGKKLERRQLGLSGRTCLLCDQPAAVCGRSRAHNLRELQAQTRTLLLEAKQQQKTRQIARLAVRSLLYEVCVTPKPGLVDRQDSGSHRDMDIFTFMSSASALQPYFGQCAHIGMDTADLPPAQTFRALRFPGKLAEAEMLRATGGVNAHKGAIFSLGLLCAAAGRTDCTDPAAILAQCAAMTEGLTVRELAGIAAESAQTAGQKLYARHGITGVRGQAEAGYPAVLQVGLPILRQGLASGLSINDAGCAALMHLMLAAEDTNLLTRGGFERYTQVKDALRQFLRDVPFPTPDLLQTLNEQFVSRNLSPGGSADLLALTFFLHFLEKENDEWIPIPVHGSCLAQRP